VSRREKLRRALTGDLDNIVLKALRKEPQRRYATVEQYSEDVRRHLENLPVIARKDTPAYRASKFILRHKTGVATTVVISLLLIVALAAATMCAVWRTRSSLMCMTPSKTCPDRHRPGR
jgi:hypothetical protein